MTKTTIRLEDMSANGQLRVSVADDGDILVTAADNAGNSVTVEFCAVGSVGAASPRTSKALMNLFAAMVEDNEDRAALTRQGPRGLGVDGHCFNVHQASSV